MLTTCNWFESFIFDYMVTYKFLFDVEIISTAFISLISFVNIPPFNPACKEVKF